MRVSVKPSRSSQRTRALAQHSDDKEKGATAPEMAEEKEVEQEEPQELRRTKRHRVKTKLYSSEEVGASAGSASKKKSELQQEAAKEEEGGGGVQTVQIRGNTLLELKRLGEKLGLAENDLDGVIAYLIRLEKDR